MILNKKTLDCQAASDLMFDYIDGALRESDAARLEEHLETCEACRRELNERRAMLLAIASSAFNAPPSLYGNVMAKLEKTPQDARILTPRRHFKPWIGALTAVCAAVMILVVGRGYLFGPQNEADMAQDLVGNARIDADVFYSPTVNDTAEYSYVGGNGAEVEIYYANNTTDDSGSVYVETTTEAVTALTPTQGVSTNAAMEDKQADDAAEGSELDLLFEKLQIGERAVLICRRSDFTGIIPDVDFETVIGDNAVYERYIIETDAMITFTGCLELLESLGVDYRAAVPTDAEFDKCEILLLIDGEN